MAIVISDGAFSERSPHYVVPRRSGGGLTWFSGGSQDYAAIWRTQPNVRTVVNFIARNCAGIGLGAFERLSDTERLSLGDHPIGEFLRNPNESLRMTRYRFIHALVSDLAIYDEAFFIKTKVGGKLRIWRIPPVFMEPVDYTFFEVKSWRFTGHPGAPVFDREDMFYFNGYDPSSATGSASPIEALRQILAEDKAAGEYREQFWQGGARISGVIERPPSGQGTPRWSPEAKERFMSEWTAKYQGAATNAGETPLLEDGMTFKQVAFSAKDSEYLGARRLSREEVASVYHVSPLFVGILENANFSNVKEQHRHLYQDTLGPTLMSIEEELQIQLVPEFPDIALRPVYFEFNLATKLKGSF